MKLLSFSYQCRFSCRLPLRLVQLRRITPIGRAWRTKSACCETASVEVKGARDGSRSGVSFGIQLDSGTFAINLVSPRGSTSVRILSQHSHMLALPDEENSILAHPQSPPTPFP